ncbi:regulatory inactivation of DnaA Hda protein [Sulfurivirga caldicuralii]|uniref:Regulatory inactivation of DnaA Hda protein n=1 Tax=Sulfurivirga caldicuralii TaxID=364032 RepID=A0A1N6F298_9GAMM|nr:DnaA/Hda family protein [Sulfurivirga caldicuralii]SIN89384.1 regulatory inactivation of DnaA Hda protein [Sulfurivirga caldicuralii]
MSAQQLPLNIELRPEASFDSYVTEQEAVAIALHQIQMAIVRNRGGSWYFFGPRGTGRTHLLQAACRLSAAWERRCAYVPLNDPDVRDYPDLLKGMEQVDVLCLDNVDAVLEREDWQGALADVLLQAQTLGRVVIMAGLQPMSLWPIRTERLTLALANVIPVGLEPLRDPQTLSLAIQRHGRVRGLKIPKTVITYLQKAYGSDLQELLAVLKIIEESSLVEKHKIDLPFVKRVLGHTHKESP